MDQTDGWIDLEIARQAVKKKLLSIATTYHCKSGLAQLCATT